MDPNNNKAVNTTGGNTSASSYDFAVIPQEIGAGTTVTVSFDVWVQDNSDYYFIGEQDGHVDLYPIEFGTPNVTEITNDVNFAGSDEVVLPTN